MLEPIVAYINENYGSKRGLLKTTKFGLLHKCGKFQKLYDLDWLRAQRFIFICAGNICRSPLAEARATSLGLTSESFGLTCDDGFPADPRAAAFGAANGLDLSAHRSRNIAAYVPTPNDILIGMEPWHADSLQLHLGGCAQLTLAGLWLTPSLPYLHDPYSSSRSFFDKCEQRVIEAVDKMATLAARQGR
jgi:low molecular weight protein-tyrosine phosphatase